MYDIKYFKHLNACVSIIVSNSLYRSVAMLHVVFEREIINVINTK